VPMEEPLGYRIDALPEEPSAVFHASPVEQTCPTSDDPSPLGRGVGPSFNDLDDPATGDLAPPSASLRGARGLAGSSPLRRRRL
jgi:hypothetical protein